MKSPALKLSLLLFLATIFLFLAKAPLITLFVGQPPLPELENPQLVKEIKAQSGLWTNDYLQPVFLNSPVVSPQEIAQNKSGSVLGLALAQGEKWIEVDLSEQKLFAHEGNNIVYTMLVSAGKWAPTPTGEFRIWIKLRYTLMHGGNQADGTYYYLPNVPYVMYFYKGYGIHGAYWHNNFGQPMSHGCVNLSIPDAEKLFWWADPQVPAGKSVAYPSQDNPGTRVVIHE
jgi:lipoprotein-anchoring transpeptidase ErfK/SrfK